MKKILLASALVLAVSAGQAHAFSFTLGGQPTLNAGLTSWNVNADNTVINGSPYFLETFDDPSNTLGKTVQIHVNNVLQDFYLAPGQGFNSLIPETDIIVREGSFGIRTGTEEGFAAAPAGDETNYAFAPNGGSSAVIEINYYNDLIPNDLRIFYLGIYYGSIDDYNNLAFYDKDGVPIQGDGALSDGILKGSEILAITGGANGNQLLPGSNVYVNLYFDYDDPIFTSFRFVTTGIAFEADNLVAGITSAAPVPEPATMLLFGAGLAGLAGIRRKRNK